MYTVYLDIEQTDQYDCMYAPEWVDSADGHALCIFAASSRYLFPFHIRAVMYVRCY